MTKFTKSELENLKRNDLVELAKERKIKNYSRMKKKQLIKALLKFQEEETVGTVGKKSRKTASRKKVEEKVIAAELEKQEESVKKMASASQKEYSDSPEVRYDLGPIQEYPALKKYYELPESYGDNKIVLMVRDPYWVFAYWEMTPAFVDHFIKEHGLDPREKEFVLRLYQVSEWDGEEFKIGNLIDFPLYSLTQKYYMNVPTPGAEYVVDFGVRTPEGEFYTMLRSNKVTVPLDKMSDAIDEKWITLADEESFRRLYELSGGEIWSTLRGSEEWTTGKGREEFISSGVSSAGASEWVYARKERGFWLKLDAELIVYGATDPEAEVYIDGEKINLNPDGTFSMRLSFPNGTIRIPVEAYSPDGKEVREIEPTFYRVTRYAQKKLDNKVGER